MNSISLLVFEALNVDALQQKAIQTLLETLDAAVYTLEGRLDKSEAKDLETQKAILEQVLKDFDYDVQIIRSNFVKEVVMSILMAPFKKFVAPHVDPILQKAEDAIPEPMQNFINLKNIMDDLIRFFVGQPIDQMVEKTFPLPK